jgi:hypothetical protein
VQTDEVGNEGGRDHFRRRTRGRAGGFVA